MLNALDMHHHFLPRSLYLGKNIPIGGTAHQAGTIRFGTDPKSSALDLDCKAHALDNLYVVDASFFVSIGGEPHSHHYRERVARRGSSEGAARALKRVSVVLSAPVARVGKGDTPRFRQKEVGGAVPPHTEGVAVATALIACARRAANAADRGGGSELRALRTLGVSISLARAFSPPPPTDRPQ